MIACKLRVDGKPGVWRELSDGAGVIGTWQPGQQLHHGEDCIMLAFYTHLSWTDEAGTAHPLPGWDSGLGTLAAPAYVHEDGSYVYCAERFSGGVCECPEPHEWRSIAGPGALLSHAGDDFPTTYTMHVDALIAIYERADEYRFRALTLSGEPVDAEQRIAELRALPAGTVVTVDEWDQS
ncbi:hypothetical protein [Leucobacter sp. gxy201]|uniref:hypothetical protein n=1 Tax=Leucobacter sp. gxy201 TaxID=2957200 RepID=UPI003DA13058